MDQLINLLARCEFIVIPDNSQTRQQFNEYISVYFCGISDAVRVLLENYVNDTASYGVELTVSNVLDYLNNHGIIYRKSMSEQLIMPALTRLNSLYKESYNPINRELFHRNSTDRLIDEIQSGKSVVLHGAAGVGKSGCIHELIDYLESHHIDYLAIQLDKDIPHNYADEYGKELGLPESPVSCLWQISGSKPCVLILDQLDSLRWTAAHSSKALDVCKELISQARGINNTAGGSISVVFSVRTIDYESDTGIQSLFNSNLDDSWSEIELVKLAVDEVKQLVGVEYNNLSTKVKELISIPSSLSVWLRLSPERRVNQFATAHDIVGEWWKQIIENYTVSGNNSSLLSDCIKLIVDAINNTGCAAIPLSLLHDYSREIDYLSSCGMLLVQKKNVSFAHQSYLDSFLLENDLRAIYIENKDILSLVLSWASQTPIYRYRLSSLLQNIIDSDQSLFVDKVYSFIKDERIHFYFKAAVFESIGQIEAPQNVLLDLVDEYFDDVDWHPFLISSVFDRHAVFIEHLMHIPTFNWLSDDGVYLLKSNKNSSPKLVSSILKRLIEIDDENIPVVMKVIGMDIVEEPIELFSLRLDIYGKDITYLSNIHCIYLEKNSPELVYKMLTMIIKNTEYVGFARVYIDYKERINFCEKNYEGIVHELFSLLCEYADSSPLSFHAMIKNTDYWNPSEHNQYLIRTVVDIVKTALSYYAHNNPIETLNILDSVKEKRNGIANEIILNTYLELSVDYSNEVLNWLLSDFDNNILDCISNKYDYLSTCKSILKKFSPMCSDEVFKELENRIISWKGDKEQYLNTYKRRTDFNHIEGNGWVYWPVWGHFQKALLPCLDQRRTKTGTKDLIVVLNRNKWVRSDYYQNPILSFHGKSVVSSINCSSKIMSDEAWIRLVRTDISEEHNLASFKYDESHCYETSHWAFAQELGACVKSDPSRYLKLLLKFPVDCYSGYYTSVLYSLRSVGENQIDYELLFEVIRYCMKNSSDDITIAVASVVSLFRNLDWPIDIVSQFVSVAIDRRRPEETVVVSGKDPNSPSADDLELSMINKPRGAVINTLGDLLLSHPDYKEYIVPALSELVDERNDIICFSLVKISFALYDHDPNMSKVIFDSIISNSLLVVYARKAYWLMCQDHNDLAIVYYPYLKKACESSNPNLIIYASKLICDTAIITNNESILEYLYTNPWTNECISEICKEAVYAFGKTDYHDVSEQVLRHFLEVEADGLDCINELFDESQLDLQQDKEFIICILQKRNSVDTYIAFLQYVKTLESDITCLAEIIQDVLINFEGNIESWQRRIIEENLVVIVMKLLDVSNDNKEITESCLVILDVIYKKHMLTNTALSSLIEGRA